MTIIYSSVFSYIINKSGENFKIIMISSQAENIFLLIKQEDIKRDKIPNRRPSDCQLASASIARIVDVTHNANIAATHNVKTPKRPR